MAKVSRRELGRLAAGLAATQALSPQAQARVPEQSSYIGPLTGITAGLEGRQFDPVAYTHDVFGVTPQRLRFQARTRSEGEV